MSFDLETSALGDPELATSVRTSRMIVIALCVGVVLFLGVTIFLPVTSGTALLTNRQLELLTAVVLVTTCLLWGAGFAVASKLRREPSLPNLRQALILEAALREGASFFGLVVLLLAKVVGGGFSGRPWVWLDALPTALFVLVSLTTLPSLEKTRRALSSSQG